MTVTYPDGRVVVERPSGPVKLKPRVKKGRRMEDAPVPEGAVVLFTDGACSGNPGRGGWGVLLQWRGRERELFGGDPETTSNRMELTAAIEGLRALTRDGLDVAVFTDSAYVRDGMTLWLSGWKRKDWVTKGGTPVKNMDLWWELDALAGRHRVVWHWVKGHAGVAGNERADGLARRGVASGRPRRPVEGPVARPEGPLVLL